MTERTKNVEKARELMDKIPYLKDFESADKDSLSRICFFREYAAGTTVIQEDSPNLELFFLIRGVVDIKSKGQHIVSLRGGGRIFGEMSFVNNALTSASVVAQNEVVMMVFTISAIHTLENEKYGRLKISFYKAIAEMLAQKLRATTDMANSYKHQLDHSEDDL